MYSRPRTTFHPAVLALAVGLFLTGCDSGSALTGAGPDADRYASPDIAAKVADAPEFSGMRVARINGDLVASLVSLEAGLSAIVGMTRQEVVAFCTGQGLSFDEIFTQVVTSPKNEDWIHILSQATAHATVYPLAGWDCPRLLQVEPIAEGLVSFQQVDNDATGEAFSNPDARHTNAWSLLVHGNLNDGTAAYRFGEQCRGNDSRGVTCKAKASLAGYDPFAFNEANGNYYKLIDIAVDWYSADFYAGLQEHEECTGHLATLTSAEENDFVANAFPMATNLGYWLGGTRTLGDPDPSVGWSWVTGEAWAYTNWAGGEPNNLSGDESSLHFSPPAYGNLVPGAWNDQAPFNIFGSADGPIPGGFVIEFECD